MLPSSIAGTTTQEVGFFALEAAELAEWLVDRLGTTFRVSRPNWQGLDAVVHAMKPAPVLSRYAWVPVDGWTVLLNNTPLGTDVGLLPSRASEAFRCRSIRAVCVDDDELEPARILQVFGPNGEAAFGVERSVIAAKDGDRWVFETEGEPFPFEDRTAYARRNTRARFTTAMLHEYLAALGVPQDIEPAWNEAYLVERVSATSA